LVAETDKTEETEEWIEVKKGKRNTNPMQRSNPTFYHNLSHLYATLPEYAAAPPTNNAVPTDNDHNNSTGTITPVPSNYKIHKQQRKLLACMQKRQLNVDLNGHIDQHIQWAEDEHTELEKVAQSKGRLAVNALHTLPKHDPISILQNGRNAGYAFATTIRRAFQRFQHANHVTFNENYNHVHFFDVNDIPSVTYDSGADGHYLNKADRLAAQLPILHSSSKQVAVANGQLSSAKHESRLPFHGLSAKATKADTFNDFPQSLMSVGKIADDGTISIFTKNGVTVHHEEDVLITCKGDPILIGVRDEHSRYRITTHSV
jgi:hypothetical protein